MSQVGYTPILVYASGTATNVPLAANLTSNSSGAELALNYADMKLYAKNSSGVVTLLASAAGASGSVTSVAATVPSFLSISGSPITTSGTLAITLSGTALPTTSGGTGLTSFTANGVVYASSSSALTTGSALTFDGSTQAVTGKFSSSNAGNENYLLSDGSTRTSLQHTGNSLYFNVNDNSATSGQFIWRNTNSFTEQMRLTSTGLGIGTSSPANKLSVVGTGTTALSFIQNSSSFAGGTNFTQPHLSINSGNDTTGNVTRLSMSVGTGAQVYLDALMESGVNVYSSLLFRTRGADGVGERMRLDSSGNLGLGVTPSAWGSGKAIELGQVTGNALWGLGINSLYLVSNARWNGSNYIYTNNGAANLYGAGTGNGTFTWFTAPSGTAGNAISFTQAMTLDASGNLGVGITSPTATLHVKGGNTNNLKVDNGGQQYTEVDWLNNGTIKAVAYWDNTNSQFLISAQAASSSLAFGTVGTERMRLNSSGNLGIGTSSPATKLHVNTGAAGYGITVAASSQTSNTYQFGIDSSSNLAIYDTNAAAQRVVLSPSGNLGLGVTPSAWVGATGFDFSAVASLEGSSTQSIISANQYNNNGTRIYKTTAAATFYRQTTGQHQWFNAPSGTAGNAISFTQAMTLDASGNLGLGTTSPVSNGSTFATLSLNGSNGGAQHFMSAGSTVMQLYNDANAFFLNASSGKSIIFQTASTERARITSGGDLLVGTTSTTAPGCVLAAVGRVAGTVSAVGTASFQAWNQATSGNNLFQQFYTEGGGGTLRGSIDYNRAGGLVAYNTTSDYRAKDIIGPVQDPGATIDALKVYEGVMKGATQSRPMLVAHEAQAVAPYAVTGEKDAVNGDGTPKFQQMDVSSLVPLLLAELQSLRRRVAQLEGTQP